MPSKINAPFTADEVQAALDWLASEAKAYGPGSPPARVLLRWLREIDEDDNNGKQPNMRGVRIPGDTT